MRAVIAAKGPVLDRILHLTCRRAQDDLLPPAYARLHAAQMKTSWGRLRQRSFVLVEGEDILASAEQYTLAAVLDGRAIDVCAIGSLCSDYSRRDLGYARLLVETLLGAAARAGAEMALLFAEDGADEDVANDFDRIGLTDLTLGVAQSERHGAPMTTVRGGEERDLAAIVAMGRTRAEPFPFHLDRDLTFIRYAITTTRLRAGLGPANTRQLHFFIAEEGITAAAYVILSVIGNRWILEECGDRDPSGARVGALLQALIAREPAERRPTIHAWLPAGFLPPQVTVVAAISSARCIRVRMLGSNARIPPLSSHDILFWRNDLL